MVALVRHVVVLRPRAEVPGLCEAGTAEQIERLVDGGGSTEARSAIMTGACKEGRLAP